MDAIPFDGPFREPSDPQLLNKFLDCVNLAKTSNQQSFVGNSEVDAQSFVSATSQVQSSDRQKVKSHLCLWYRFLFHSICNYCFSFTVNSCELEVRVGITESTHLFGLSVRIGIETEIFTNAWKFWFRNNSMLFLTRDITDTFLRPFT